MIKVIFVAITVLWVQVPTQDWDTEERVFLPRSEKVFIVDSPIECAINLFSMNLMAQEKDAKYTAILLRIDLEKSLVDTVEIPDIIFKTQGEKP